MIYIRYSSCIEKLSKKPKADQEASRDECDPYKHEDNKNRA
jgi:hypothetical protein